ncbi:hypothetical protein EYZ11_000309 [Aspergillus tanneri]|uniref:Mitochondrial inner membrane protease subunit 2 n=1 Tax=Aspergillus tanneri TaxID=1220188 RepID=A0A4S3JXK2_9EURO|nr:hypothetical protein EYZ11_000309 [Aspergillus tanneri]
MAPPKPMRVLPPDVAKSRSSMPHFSRTSPPQPQPQPQSQPSKAEPQPLPSQQPTRPFSLFSLLRIRFAALPSPVRRSFRALRIVTPLLPIGLFFSEHVLQVMWVRGPSMTPVLNEDHDIMHTKSDMVLVNLWPWGGAGWPWERNRRLERGMIVTFRFGIFPSFLSPLLGVDWEFYSLTDWGVVLDPPLIPRISLLNA